MISLLDDDISVFVNFRAPEALLADFVLPLNPQSSTQQGQISTKLAKEISASSFGGTAAVLFHSPLHLNAFVVFLSLRLLLL